MIIYLTDFEKDILNCLGIDIIDDKYLYNIEADHKFKMYVGLGIDYTEYTFEDDNNVTVIIRRPDSKTSINSKNCLIIVELNGIKYLIKNPSFEPKTSLKSVTISQENDTTDDNYFEIALYNHILTPSIDHVLRSEVTKLDDNGNKLVDWQSFSILNSTRFFKKYIENIVGTYLIDKKIDDSNLGRSIIKITKVFEKWYSKMLIEIIVKNRDNFIESLINEYEKLFKIKQDNPNLKHFRSDTLSTDTDDINSNLKSIIKMINHLNFIRKLHTYYEDDDYVPDFFNFFKKIIIKLINSNNSNGKKIVNLDEVIKDFLKHYQINDNGESEVLTKLLSNELDVSSNCSMPQIDTTGEITDNKLGIDTQDSQSGKQLKIKYPKND